jgi:hypothetical protein
VTWITRSRVAIANQFKARTTSCPAEWLEESQARPTFTPTCSAGPQTLRHRWSSCFHLPTSSSSCSLPSFYLLSKTTPTDVLFNAFPSSSSFRSASQPLRFACTLCLRSASDPGRSHSGRVGSDARSSLIPGLGSEGAANGLLAFCSQPSTASVHSNARVGGPLGALGACGLPLRLPPWPKTPLQTSAFGSTGNAGGGTRTPDTRIMIPLL